jgi:signal peptidase I
MSSALSGLIAFVMDILETIVFVGTIFIVIYLYLIQPNQVKGQSMYPTFEDRDYIFTSKISYRVDKPKHGDIVVFRSPQNRDIEYIKRIIALPGDTVVFRNCKTIDNMDCDVEVNGRVIEEPYIDEKTPLPYNSKYAPDQKIEVPPQTVFVMGDNRGGSLDSRFFGPVPMSDVIGLVFFRYLPLSKVGVITNTRIHNYQ